MKIKKLVKQHNQDLKDKRFYYELTPYGSLISSLLMVTNQSWGNEKYVRLLTKARFPYLDDTDFVGRTLRAVGLDINDFKGQTIGMYEGRHGVVFAPVAPVRLQNKDGSQKDTVLPLPLKSYPEGFFPATIVNNVENVQLMTL